MGRSKIARKMLLLGLTAFALDLTPNAGLDGALHRKGIVMRRHFCQGVAAAASFQLLPSAVHASSDAKEAVLETSRSLKKVKIFRCHPTSTLRHTLLSPDLSPCSHLASFSRTRMRL